MLKRFSCFVLAAVMVLGIIFMAPVTVHAASSMSVSDECVELIKQMEGFTAVPRWDYVQWTVGFGTRCPDEHLDRYLETGIPVDEAEALLAEKLVYFDNEVNKFIDKHGLTLNQGQFDAIFSLTYNCGPAWLYKDSSTLIDAIVNGVRGNEFTGIISTWCTAGGEFLSGLMRRRLVEADMYLNGNYALYAPSYYCYIRYSYEGATCDAQAQGYDSRMAAWPMYTPVKEGYTFAGWYTAADGGTKVEVLDESTNGITLYAQWTEGTSGDSSSGSTTTAVTVTVTGDVVNVRSGPGTSYGVVLQVTEGTTLVITAVQDVNGTLWGKYSKGWLCLDYTNYAEVVGNGGSTETPDPGDDDGEEKEDTLPEVPMDATIIGTDSVTVYNGPHTSYPKLGTLARGDKVELLEIMDFMGTRWGRYEGGWICLNGYVLLHDDTVLINTFEVTITNSWLNVRSGPGTNYSVVTTLGLNDVVEILALQQVGNTTWGRFEKGWISLYYTNYDPSMVPDQTPPPEEEEPTCADGHTYESVTTAPTCDAAGYTTHTCTVCGDSYTDSEVAALGHTYESVVTDPTCDAAGYTTHTCTTCGHSYTDSQVEALPHTYESVVTDPTCAAAGYTTHTCTTCGHSYTDSQVEALPHTYESVVTDPTCDAAGYTTHTCTVCGYSHTDSETAALGHSYTSVVTAPTTTEKGYTTHTCTACGHSYVDSYTDPIPETVTVTRTYATITASALTIRSGAGTGYGALGYYYNGTKVEILEQKTVSGKVWGKTDKGWICLTGYTKLETVTEEVEVPGTTVKRTYATIIASSLNIRSGAGTGYSWVGSYAYGTKVEILEQKTVGSNVWGKTDKGWICLTGHTTLEVVEEGTVEHTHSYTSQVTAPTCEKGGYTTHTCTVCGHSYTDSETAALGHSYTSVVTAPTTTAQGYTTHTCTTCGHSYVDSYTDPVPGENTVKRTYATIIASSLNIRSGAGTGYSWVGSYAYGTKVEILEQKTVGSNVWGKTSKGWICLTGHTKLETVTEAAPSTVVMTVIASSLNIRSGPGTGYSWVGAYAYGTKVEVLEQKTVGSVTWARTNKGWVSMQYLK